MEEEIIYFQGVWNLIHRQVYTDLKNSELKKKSNIEADALNNKAYNLMVAGNLDESEYFFKKALILAEYNSSEFGNILYNFAALRILQHDHQNCIELIDQCLGNIYGQTNFIQVCTRKIVAYAFMGNTESKDDTFNKLLMLVDCNKWSFDLLRDAEEFLMIKKDKDFYEREDLLLPKVTPNVKVVNVCEHAEIKYSERYGRQVVTKELIKKGDVILVDTPFVCLGLDYCSKCYKKCHMIVPCTLCCFCVYCSNNCRQGHKKFHKFECPLFQSEIMKALDMKTLLAFRLFIKGLQSGFKKCVMSQRATSYGDASNMFPHIQTLYPGYSKVVPQLMKYAAINSAILTAYINTNESLRDSITSKIALGNMANSELNLTIGAHIMRLIIIVQYNSYIFGSEVNNRTAMLYPCYSLFNHSCCPNTIRYLSGSEIVLKASENIEPGKQVFTSYGIASYLTSKDKRKMYLQKYYNFNCVCKMCTVPYDKSLRNIIKCTGCSSYASLEKSKLVCQSCKNVTDIKVETMMCIKRIYELIKEYQSDLNIENLYNAVKLGEEIKLNPKHSIIATCYYELGREEISYGHLKKALKYLNDTEIDQTNYLFFIDILLLIEKNIKRIYFSENPYEVKDSKKVIKKCLQFLNNMRDALNLYHPKRSLLDMISRLEKYYMILKCISEFETSSLFCKSIVVA